VCVCDKTPLLCPSTSVNPSVCHPLVLCTPWLQTTWRGWYLSSLSTSMCESIIGYQRSIIALTIWYVHPFIQVHYGKHVGKERAFLFLVNNLHSPLPYPSAALDVITVHHAHAEKGKFLYI